MRNFISDYFFFDGWPTNNQKQLALRSQEYLVIAWQLYKKGIDQVLRCCVLEHEKVAVLQEAHQEVFEGHYAVAKATKHWIL